MSMDMGIGAGIAASDSAVSGAVALKQANTAWSRQKHMMKHAVKHRVADLRAAGLNPVLAASMGFGGGMPSSVGQAKINPSNAAAAVSGAAKSFSQAKVNAKQLALIEQQVLESKAREFELNTAGVRNQQTGDRDTASRDHINLQRELLKFSLPRAIKDANAWNSGLGTAAAIKNLGGSMSVGIGKGGFNFSTGAGK